jgi:hypothetical protein
MDASARWPIFLHAEHNHPEPVKSIGRVVMSRFLWSQLRRIGLGIHAGATPSRTIDGGYKGRRY